MIGADGEAQIIERGGEGGMRTKDGLIIDTNEKLVSVERSQVIATWWGSGFSWTLASRLGEMLALAEEYFGPRDRSYTILGIEFSEAGPQIWYPSSNRNIIVQLGLAALTNTQLALYQLAHECVHLLSPTGRLEGNVLDEGLATLFSVDFMTGQFPSSAWPTRDRQYADAEAKLVNLWT